MTNLVRTGKPEKIECESCGCNQKEILHHHHIIERKEINTDNSYWNLVVLCPNCHYLHHIGVKEIIAVYPSTRPPLGRSVIYKDDDSGIKEPYYNPTPKSIKYYVK